MKRYLIEVMVDEEVIREVREDNISPVDTLLSKEMGWVRSSGVTVLTIENITESIEHRPTIEEEIEVLAKEENRNG